MTYLLTSSPRKALWLFLASIQQVLMHLDKHTEFISSLNASVPAPLAAKHAHVITHI